MVFYQVLKLKLQHRLFKGGWSKELQRELVVRLPAVAVLMYDAKTDQVVLIEQFRVGGMAHENGPWQLEMVAGMIDTQETSEQVAVRECKEESGAVIAQRDLELVCKYLVTPGGSNESLAIYCAPVDASQIAGIHGLPTEGEDIKVQVINRPDLWAHVRARAVDQRRHYYCHSVVADTLPPDFKASGAVNEFAHRTNH